MLKIKGGFILPEFFDVSLPVTEEMVVYPGNPKLSIRRYASVSQDKVNESILTLGGQTGGRELHLCLLRVFMGNAGFLTWPMWKRKSTGRPLRALK